MQDEVKQLFQQSNHEVIDLAAKSGVGIIGSFTAMSVNDWAGLIVAILTGIYMCFQIESAWRNRKSAKMTQKKIQDE